MNKTSDVIDNLKAAAEAGDINLLYSVIQDDPSVLESIDKIPFVDTPLHIAASKEASKEHLQFATEVMMLKPSLAWKLNQQGYSPIHLAMQNNLEMRNNLEMQNLNSLAMQNNQKRMVLCFVDINKDLVRIKGREGLTPLHLASQAGEIDLLAEFLIACPESIEDVTARRETALHIAVKNGQFEALQVLVGWLKRNTQNGARDLEYEILNKKEEAGNTILHVAGQNNQSQALRVLLKTEIILNAKNLENKTALDIAGNAVTKKMLDSAGAKPGSTITVARTPAQKLGSKITILGQINTFIFRIKRDMSDEQRNALLIVATLVLTATYQSVLTPPGGVYQISSGDNNVNTTSLNSTTTAIPRNVGKSILSKRDFNCFLFTNLQSFLVSTVATTFLIPAGRASIFVLAPMMWFDFCYYFSVNTISRQSENPFTFLGPGFAFFWSYMLFIYYIAVKRRRII